MLPGRYLDTLFMDRDGVLNTRIIDGYVLKEEEIEIIPGVNSFLDKAAKYFKRIVVVSNQRCIGRGLLSVEKLAAINDRINALTGLHIDKFYVCPHLDEDKCECRKPRNGLFIQAKADHPIDFANSWMIGDSESDLVPARGLGIRTYFLSELQSNYADFCFTDFGELDKYFDGWQPYA